MPRLHALRPYLVVGLLNASEGMLTMLAPPYMDSLGFTATAIGALVSTYAVACLVARFPAGALYQRVSARVLIAGALLAMALASLLYPRAADAAGLVLVRALQGLAYGLASTVNLALFIDLLPTGASRPHAMGYFTGALSVGFTAGGLISGFAADWYGYPWAFAIAAVPSLLALPSIQGPHGGTRGRPAAPGPVTPLRPGPGMILQALRARGVLPVALLAFFLAFLLNVQSTFVPLYALSIGLGLADIGLLKTFHSICNTITRPFSGGVLQRLGHTRIGVGALAVNAVLLVLMPSFTAMAVLSVMMMAIGLARGMAMVANTVGVASDVDESQISRGMASGIYYASRDVGGILGPVVGGAVSGLLGVDGMLRVLPPLVALAYLTGVVASRRSVPDRRPVPASRAEREGGAV